MQGFGPQHQGDDVADGHVVGGEFSDARRPLAVEEHQQARRGLGDSNAGISAGRHACGRRHWRPCRTGHTVPFCARHSSFGNNGLPRCGDEPALSSHTSGTTALRCPRRPREVVARLCRCVIDRASDAISPSRPLTGACGVRPVGARWIPYLNRRLGTPPAGRTSVPGQLDSRGLAHGTDVHHRRRIATLAAGRRVTDRQPATGHTDSARTARPAGMSATASGRS